MHLMWLLYAQLNISGVDGSMLSQPWKDHDERQSTDEAALGYSVCLCLSDMPSDFGPARIVLVREQIAIPLNAFTIVVFKGLIPHRILHPIIPRGTTVPPWAYLAILTGIPLRVYYDGLQETVLQSAVADLKGAFPAQWVLL